MKLGPTEYIEKKLRAKYGKKYDKYQEIEFASVGQDLELYDLMKNLTPVEKEESYQFSQDTIAVRHEYFAKYPTDAESDDVTQMVPTKKKKRCTIL